MLLKQGNGKNNYVCPVKYITAQTNYYTTASEIVKIA